MKKMGKRFYVYPGAYITHSYGIEIGNDVAINWGAYIDGRGGIKIGSGVLIGPHVTIVSSNHNCRQCEKPMYQTNHVMKPVEIEDDVWICANVVIGAGVHIGKGAVISGGSLVKKDVPEYAIVRGVPAEIVGLRDK